MLTMTTYDVVR